MCGFCPESHSLCQTFRLSFADGTSALIGPGGAECIVSLFLQVSCFDLSSRLSLHCQARPRSCRQHTLLVAFQTQTQNRSVLATQFPKSHPCPPSGSSESQLYIANRS